MSKVDENAKRSDSEKEVSLKDIMLSHKEFEVEVRQNYQCLNITQGSIKAELKEDSSVGHDITGISLAGKR